MQIAFADAQLRGQVRSIQRFCIPFMITLIVALSGVVIVAQLVKALS